MDVLPKAAAAFWWAPRVAPVGTPVLCQPSTIRRKSGKPNTSKVLRSIDGMQVLSHTGHHIAEADIHRLPQTPKPGI